MIVHNRNRNSRAGMTLLEVSLASALLTVLMMLGMSAFVDVVRAVNTQDSVTQMGQQANKALREIADLVKPAILPVFVERTVTQRNDTTDIYFDIDNRDWGFGGLIGQRWLDNLQDGMDAIAFVVPIDAQNVGDFLDGANHLQIGQKRGGVSYLSATTTGIPGSGSSFRIRNGTEPVNVLAVMNPDGFTDPAFENKRNVTQADWRAAFAAGPWPEVTCFVAVRFVPVTDSGGTPVTLSETNFFNNSTDVDLDGDGRTDGVFQVGQLQLVYSGGDRFRNVSGSTVVTSDVPQIIQPLTPNVVLRRANQADRTPIFRLVDFDYGNLESGGGNAGMIGEGGGKAALSIKLLMLDRESIANDLANASSSRVIPLARWYETKVILKNMTR